MVFEAREITATLRRVKHNQTLFLQLFLLENSFNAYNYIANINNIRCTFV